MSDEPRKHPLFLLLVLVAIFGSIPVFFVGKENHLLWGVPVWLLVSFSFTILLSIVTAWGILKFWKDDVDD